MKLSALFVCLIAPVAQAQIFSVLPVEPPGSPAWSAPGPRPERRTIVRVKNDALGALLAKAPAQRHDAPLSAYGLHIALPGPSGELVPCIAAESPVMEAPLQQKYPGMRTYIVQSADGDAVGRLEQTQRGITAMLRTAGTAWMIDQWQSGDAEHVVSYYLRDLPGGGEWACHTHEGVHAFGAREDEVGQRGGGGSGGPRELQILRTMRAALACTGEYGVHHSQIQGHAPNVADPLAAIVTIIGRVNVVYESDLSIHFNLVAENDRVIFFDPVTDPYPTTCDGSGGGDCSSSLASANRGALNNHIGEANFDIGQVVTRVAGGVAYLSSACGSNKGRAASGIPRGGDIDPFAAIVVVHEMGHQLGAEHTFSGVHGRCANNVNLPTAWEPGSGSTPMGYAGGCPVGSAPPSDNLVVFADPYFHLGSLAEIRTFLVGITCPVQTTTTNNVPVIESITPTSFIPPGTPFVLAATVSDADGEPLAYSWEQFDPNVARPLIDATDNGSGALFRVFPPVSSPQRTFPQIADVLSGVPTPGERLPTHTGAVRRFRLCVRDNRPGSGGVAISPSVIVNVALGATPFSVTAPAEGTIRRAGPSTVTWTVGNTNTAPISCFNVTIRLSTDNGATFDQVLGSFPNNGSATVVLPATTANARIRIDPNARIFFAMSRPFVIQAPCAADFNYDNAANSQDFFDFLSAFFELDNSSDFNHDTFINSQDYFDFLAAFFAGC